MNKEAFSFGFWATAGALSCLTLCISGFVAGFLMSAGWP